MAPTAPTSVAWNKDHDLELARAIIQNTLAVRSAIYHTPGLADVAGNGGDRINKKLQAILKAIPGGEDIVKEEVAKLGRGGKRKEAEGRDETESPKKKPTPTKRKAAAKKATKKDTDEAKGTESDE